MRNSNEITLKEAIQQFLKSNPYIKDKLMEKNIQDIWEKIMGKMINKRTKKIVFKKNILIIEVNSASLRNELSFAKEKIKTLINTELGEEVIKEVKIS